MFRFFPRPLFLDELRLLSKLRVFLIDFAGGEFVGNDDVKPVAFHPLPELSVGKLFSIDVAQPGKSVRRPRRLSNFESENRRYDTARGKD